MSSSTSLHWLIEAVAIRRDRVVAMLRQMTGLGPRGGMSLPAFRKFLQLLDQIAVERRQEDRLLDRIADVEARHRFRRNHGQLAHGEQASRLATMVRQNRIPAPQSRPKRRLSWLAVLFLLFRPKLK